MKFHHIGIAVQDLKKANIYFKTLFQIKKTSKVFKDKNLKVNVQFLMEKKNIVYEIIEPASKKSPISGALKENRNILNHVAYISENFDLDCKKMRNNGAIPIGVATPAVAFKNKKIQFFYTKLKFLFEMIEK